MWFVLAFLTAFFVSLTDAFGKKVLGKIDAYVVAWGWPFYSLPFLYSLLLIEDIPTIGPHFWFAVSVSTVLLVFASIFYFKAIQASDLSITVPMLAFSPVFLLVTSPLILGEFPKPLGVGGILLIVIGSYVLNIKDRHKGYLAPFKKLITEKGPRYMLIVAFLYSIGANFDKIGVTNSSPLMWLVAINTAICFPLFFIMKNKTTDIHSQLKIGWRILLLMGFFSSIAHLLQMHAIQFAIVPYVIAIKRMSVFFSSLWGFLIFKEKGMRERSIGAMLMIGGVFMILLSH